MADQAGLGGRRCAAGGGIGQLRHGVGHPEGGAGPGRPGGPSICTRLRGKRNYEAVTSPQRGLDGPQRTILLRRCATILASASEFDDDLVALCRMAHGR